VTLPVGQHALWPTPLGVHRHSDAAPVDVDPEPGQLVLFPSWLAHRALPYDGAAERIVVSFNASVHDARGSDRRHGYAPA